MLSLSSSIRIFFVSDFVWPNDVLGFSPNHSMSFKAFTYRELLDIKVGLVLLVLRVLVVFTVLVPVLGVLDLLVDPSSSLSSC